MTDREAIYIVVEGIDGSGKTTLIRNIQERLQGANVPHLITREPTYGPYGQQIRQRAANSGDPLTPAEEVQLFLSDRRDHVKSILNKDLQKHQIILQDRSYLSSAAYQGAYPQYSIEKILELNNFAPIPDLVIYLDICPEKAIARLTENRDELDEFEKPDHLKKVRENYLFLVKNYSKTKFIIFEEYPELSLKNMVAAKIFSLWHSSCTNKEASTPDMSAKEFIGLGRDSGHDSFHILASYEDEIEEATDVPGKINIVVKEKNN